jgi:prephenate dehydrogenase
MPVDSDATSCPFMGIIGFGAFGQLTARHLQQHFRLCAYDPAFPPASSVEFPEVMIATLATAASCPVVILATPVNRLRETVEAVRPHLRPGSLVLDVASVKTVPAEIMRKGLPAQVDIVATHPLFGPQSARDGIAGLKIAICPIRGKRGPLVASFLRRTLHLNVIMTTPEAHDREAAMVQGLTHLIAKVLVQMEPLPTSMTTRSFDLLTQAVNMVRHDAPEVFQAIERANPYSQQVRERFFDLAFALNTELAENQDSLRDLV